MRIDLIYERQGKHIIHFAFNACNYYHLYGPGARGALQNVTSPWEISLLIMRVTFHRVSRGYGL